MPYSLKPEGVTTHHQAFSSMYLNDSFCVSSCLNRGKLLVVFVVCNGVLQKAFVFCGLVYVFLSVMYAAFQKLPFSDTETMEYSLILYK